MNEIDVADVVRDNNRAEFDSYRAGKFYYRVTVNGDEYLFPVDQEDLEQSGSTPTLNRAEKAITLMRYVRRAMEEDTFRPAD